MIAKHFLYATCKSVQGLRKEFPEKKIAGVRTQKGGHLGKNHTPPSFKLNGRSLIIILNLWTLQRVDHYIMEHGEECSAVCSVQKF